MEHTVLIHYYQFIIINYSSISFLFLLLFAVFNVFGILYFVCCQSVEIWWNTARVTGVCWLSKVSSLQQSLHFNWRGNIGELQYRNWRANKTKSSKNSMPIFGERAVVAKSGLVITKNCWRWCWCWCWCCSGLSCCS